MITHNDPAQIGKLALIAADLIKVGTYRPTGKRDLGIIERN